VGRRPATHGDRPALVARHQGIRWTYAELHDRVEQCARGLLAAGVAKGDRVGIWSPNKAEWVIVEFATAKIGAILVNINPSYRAHELEYALRQSGCSLLILAPGFKDADYRELLAGIDARDVRRSVVLGEQWDELLAAGDAVAADELRAREAELDFDDPINIQYTSGTTGFPKGATLSHHILNNGFFIGEVLGYTAEDVCIPVPFYHCFGMVLGNLAVVTHGACIVLPSEAFDALAVLETVAEERCTSPLRRADDVHRRARRPALRQLRPDEPPHRNHGRLRRARWR
jgi:fatty-acyl-CoA synthase